MNLSVFKANWSIEEKKKRKINQRNCLFIILPFPVNVGWMLYTWRITERVWSRSSSAVRVISFSCSNSCKSFLSLGFDKNDSSGTARLIMLILSGILTREQNPPKKTFLFLYLLMSCSFKVFNELVCSSPFIGRPHHRYSDHVLYLKWGSPSTNERWSTWRQTKFKFESQLPTVSSVSDFSANAGNSR